MRTPPPFQVTLQRFGVWHGAVRIASGLGAAVIVAWVVLQPRSPSLWSLIAAGCGVMAVLGLGASLARSQSSSLRWDGQAWHLGPAESRGDEPLTGSLAVALDFGSWMLLRFTPDAPALSTSNLRAAKPRQLWLPAQRSGLEAQWHALRCAVHAPRHAAAADAPAEF